MSPRADSASRIWLMGNCVGREVIRKTKVAQPSSRRPSRLKESPPPPPQSQPSSSRPSRLKEPPPPPQSQPSSKRPSPPPLPAADPTVIDMSSDTLLEATRKARRMAMKVTVLAAIAEDEELHSEFADVVDGKDFDGIELTEAIAVRVSSKVMAGVDRAVNRMIKAQCVTICFLVDTTGSMEDYIRGVKKDIKQMVQAIRRSHAVVGGVSFVGYKDWCDGENHFEILEFTDNLDTFDQFLSAIVAKGGGDFPEDVLGGLWKAVNLRWPSTSGTRIIFHIADAPPHGSPLYHSSRDEYPSGHPKDPALDTLFTAMREQSILYYFGRITRHCDKMIAEFEKHYGDKIDAYSMSNPSDISVSVIDSVMKSVAISSSLAGHGSSLSTKRVYTVDPNVPDWSSIQVATVTSSFYELPKNILAIIKYEPLKYRQYKAAIKIAPSPFSKGSVRYAFYGQEFDLKTRLPKKEIVLKEMINTSTASGLEASRYLSEVETQTVAAKLALEFTDKLAIAGVNIKVKYLKSSVIRIKMKGGIDRYLFKEPKFYDTDMKMVKFTNNWNFELADFKSPDMVLAHDVSVALSHFSHHETNKYLLLCDVQGILYTDDDGVKTLSLTDPAIHCPKDMRFGGTNLGQKGIDAFFKKHKCNEYCSKLNLSRSDLKDDKR